MAPERALKFSVVIPAYNAENTIERAISSVLAQSYPPFEIIIVDDTSKDKTQEIIESKYADAVKYIQKISNNGSSVARNTGMDAAKGDYIAFLDADDAWHPDKLLLINTVFCANPGITLFYHQYTLENIMQKALPENITVYKLPFIKLLPGNIISTSCIVIRNDPSFRFEPTMRYLEDFDLCLRVGYKHKLYFVDIPLTQLYRKVNSAGGISENKWKMRKGEMRAYTRLPKLNPLFVFLLPFLLVSSLGKHVIKAVTKR